MRRICAILRHKDIGGVRRDVIYRLSISRFFPFHASVTPTPSRGSVDSSLVRLGRAVFTLRPDAVCYESKFRLGIWFRNYISEQKESGCSDLWQCCGVVLCHIVFPQLCQVICFWLLCGIFYFLLVSENITVGRMAVWYIMLVNFKVITQI